MQQWTPDTNQQEIMDRLDALSREVGELKVAVADGNARYAATTMYYEQRVDLIYQRVVHELRAMLGIGKIDVITNYEVDAVLGRYFLGAFQGNVSVPADLREAVLSELRPGLLGAPLTLRGFRINRRRGRERGDGIEMYGNERGIVVFGPYKHVKAGRYTISAHITIEGKPQPNALSDANFALDIVCSRRQEVVAAQIDPPIGDTVHIGLELDWPGGALELRVHNNADRPALLTAYEIKLELV